MDRAGRIFDGGWWLGDQKTLGANLSLPSAPAQLIQGLTAGAVRWIKPSGLSRHRCGSRIRSCGRSRTACGADGNLKGQLCSDFRSLVRIYEGALQRSSQTTTRCTTLVRRRTFLSVSVRCSGRHARVSIPREQDRLSGESAALPLHPPHQSQMTSRDAPFTKREPEVAAPPPRDFPCCGRQAPVLVSPRKTNALWCIGALVQGSASVVAQCR